MAHEVLKLELDRICPFQAVLRNLEFGLVQQAQRQFELFLMVFLFKGNFLPETDSLGTILINAAVKMIQTGTKPLYIHAYFQEDLSRRNVGHLAHIELPLIARDFANECNPRQKWYL